MTEKMWELKNTTTGDVLEGPIPLPENWGPIFGMDGIKADLGNLDWLGDPKYPNHGWIETAAPVPESAKPSSPTRIAMELAKDRLRESDWTMLPDVPMTVGVKQQWIDYRAALRDIHTQAEFPNNVIWPVAPE